MEKDKTIASLEFQLKSSTATITVLNADRTRLASEVDSMALRLEEIEYSNNLQSRGFGLNHQESASLYSYDDEAIGFSEKPSQVHSRNSYVDSDEGSSGFGTLKRAANFSNINQLEQSADFQIESATMLSDPFSSINTTTSIVASPDAGCKDVNQNVVCDDNGDGLQSGKKVTESESPQDEISETKTENESCRNVDTTNENQNSQIDESNNENDSKISTIALKNTWEDFDSKNLIDARYIEKSDVVNDELSNGNPWVSPTPSPIILRKSNLSQNPFWESNSVVSKLPFFVPKDPDEQQEISATEEQIASPQENSKDDFPNPESLESTPVSTNVPSSSLIAGSAKPDMQFENSGSYFLGSDFAASPCFHVVESTESTPEATEHNPEVTKLRASSLVVKSGKPNVLSPRENIWDRKKSNSWNACNRERSKVLPRISSKDDLWDFEPDSIVDVSTGN